MPVWALMMKKGTHNLQNFLHFLTTQIQNWDYGSLGSDRFDFVSLPLLWRETRLLIAAHRSIRSSRLLRAFCRQWLAGWRKEMWRECRWDHISPIQKRGHCLRSLFLVDAWRFTMKVYNCSQLLFLFDANRVRSEANAMGTIVNLYVAVQTF